MLVKASCGHKVQQAAIRKAPVQARHAIAPNLRVFCEVTSEARIEGNAADR
jgi:hypothetical protein